MTANILIISALAVIWLFGIFLKSQLISVKYYTLLQKHALKGQQHITQGKRSDTLG